jgi:uncharacterized protein (DUF885 family)
MEISEASAALNDYFEAEFEKDVAESPMMQTQLGRKTDYGKWDDFSNKKLVQDLEQAKERQKYLKDNVEEIVLNDETRLSYRLFKQEVENEITDFEFRFHNYPVNQMFGFHSQLPAFLINMHRIDSVADAKAYISRLNGIPKAFDDVIEGIKLREQNGILPPKFVFEKVLDDSQNVIKGKPFTNSTEASVLLDDFKTKVSKLDLSQSQQRELIAEAEKALVKSVKPAYEKLIATMEDQQQRATSDYGAWKFPKGEAFYKNRLKRITTTDLTANEIHEIGLAEVARISSEMEKVKKEVGFDGDLKSFFDFVRNKKELMPYTDPQQVIDHFNDIYKKMKPQVDRLFSKQPKTAFEVRRTEAFREASASAEYNPGSLDGTRPGIFYVPIPDVTSYNIYSNQDLFLHEAIPGHHFQVSLTQENQDLPQFRKTLWYSAYGEGWALYTESLGKELGLYDDPYQYFGMLGAEMHRAVRLVVDTGLHSKGWTREEAIQYSMDNEAISEAGITSEIERYMANPGQALSYKIGQLKILELRAKAESKFGNDFDIKVFHEKVLETGCVPLEILETKMLKWINGYGMKM